MFWIGTGWKMNHTAAETRAYVAELLGRLPPRPQDVSVFIVPPFTALAAAREAIGVAPLLLGAQNMHWAEAGAYTGEVSAEMLAKLNVRYVLVGHSERRAMFGETDEVVRLKLDAVLRHAMVPILCVGETLEQREAGAAESTVAAQLTAALADRGREALDSIVVAYEPVWAIGTGRTASADDAQAMAASIRGELELLGGEVSRTMLVQYGGSVTPDNAGELLACPDVDGLLVGGASLDADKFVAIASSGT